MCLCKGPLLVLDCHVHGAADRLVSMLRPMALLSTEQESLLREIEPALETYYDPHLKDASRKSAIGMWWYMMGERCLVAI